MQMSHAEGRRALAETKIERKMGERKITKDRRDIEPRKTRRTRKTCVSWNGRSRGKAAGKKAAMNRPHSKSLSAIAHGLVLGSPKFYRESSSFGGPKQRYFRGAKGDNHAP